jgi:hypothetical protein
VFCDDDTVKILSGMPDDRFVSSSGSPTETPAIVSYLKEHRVGYLVYDRREGSAAVTLFRDLGDERTTRIFELVESTDSDFRVYRTVF